MLSLCTFDLREPGALPQVISYASWSVTRKGAQQAVAQAGGGHGARYNGRAAGPRDQGRPGKVFGRQPDGFPADAVPGAKRRRCVSKFCQAALVQPSTTHTALLCSGRLTLVRM
jgi:hypothetical protein